MMLSATALGFSYGLDEVILNSIDLTVANAEVVALLGPSGCGKTTLLRLLANLLPMQGGIIDWPTRATFSLVLQEPALMPWASVFGNVALPLKFNSALSAAEKQQRIMAALAEVELDGFAERMPNALSGGQKMRVSIARALVSQPSVLLLDEPFSALDEILRFKMNDLLLNLRDKHHLSCVFVTHSVYEAAYLSDRVLIMHNGAIAGSVSPSLNRALAASDQRASGAFSEATRTISALLAGQGI